MSSIRLFILDSFARHGEMHGHQLRLQAEEEHVQLWTDITVGSLYGAIKRLASDGLISVVRSEREGNFPERHVYDITDAGRVTLARVRHDGLTRLTVRPDPFDLALSRLDPERIDDLQSVLAARLDDLRGVLTWTREHNAHAEPYLGVSEKIALSHREHTLASEIAWTETVLAQVPAIVRDESTKPLSKAVLASKAGGAGAADTPDAPGPSRAAPSS